MGSTDASPATLTICPWTTSLLIDLKDLTVRKRFFISFPLLWNVPLWTPQSIPPSCDIWQFFGSVYAPWKETRKIFQSFWAEGHTAFEIFFFNWNSKHPPLQEAHQINSRQQNSPANLSQSLYNLLLAKCNHTGRVCLYFFLLEDSRLAMSYNLYYLNLNAYLDSKFFVGTQ